MEAGQAAIVIFGAAVWADGPSPALARRIASAAEAAAAAQHLPILCSGAAGRVGRSEASVMAEVLAAHGVAAHRLTLDESSRDTLQSVLAAARFVRLHRLEGCVVCSDDYHLPRIRLLLAALGVRTIPGPRPRKDMSLRHWTVMRLREALAIPYDLAIVLVRRRSLLAAIRELA